MQNNPNNISGDPNSVVPNANLNYIPEPSFDPSAIPQVPQVENIFDPNLDYNNFNQPQAQTLPSEQLATPGYNNFDYNNTDNLGQNFDILNQNSLPTTEQFQDPNYLPLQQDYYQDPQDPNNGYINPNYNSPYNIDAPDLTNQVDSNILPNNTEFNQSTPTTSNTLKKKSNLIFYVASGIAMLVLIGVIGFLAYLFLSQNNAPKNDDVNNTTVSQSSSIDNNIAANTSNSVETAQSSSSEGSNSTNDSTSVTLSSQSQSQIAISGSNVNSDTFKDPKGSTPASLARKNTDSVINALYLKKYFPNDLTDDSKCKTETICGNGVDSDADGLNNLEEYNYDTNPIKNDTDSDEIADGDEVKVYGTNPTVKDSDLDKYDDNKELITCYDPAIKTSNKFTSTKKQQITDLVKASPLHEPTISAMKLAGATDGDLVNGYIARECTTGLVGGQN